MGDFALDYEAIKTTSFLAAHENQKEKVATLSPTMCVCKNWGINVFNPLCHDAFQEDGLEGCSG